MVLRGTQLNSEIFSSPSQLTFSKCKAENPFRTVNTSSYLQCPNSTPKDSFSASSCIAVRMEDADVHIVVSLVQLLLLNQNIFAECKENSEQNRDSHKQKSNKYVESGIECFS